MASELDEGRRCIPISELKPLQTEWLIKVLVLRKGPKRDYKTSNGEGVIRSVICVDEEGTKIQGTLFNEQVETWEDDFTPLQAYYIEDGKIFTPKANYISVNPDVEISFRPPTKVTECDSDFNTEHFAAGFITFVEAARMPLGTLFDVAGILLDVKVLIGEGRKTRREAVITDDRYDRKTVTLWGDLAEIEGALMASSKHKNPVIAFCNIRGSIYQGEFGLSTTPVSCVLIEPELEIAAHLHNWHTAMKDCSVDIRFMPSRLMQETTEVALSDIVKPTSTSFKTQYYRFVAKLVDIINLDDLWYAACTRCYRKVIVKKSTASCDYCRKKDTDYENRYRMKIVVSAEKVENTVLTLFGGARFFVGCDVNDYIQSASGKVVTQDKEMAQQDQTTARKPQRQSESSNTPTTSISSDEKTAAEEVIAPGSAEQPISGTQKHLQRTPGQPNKTLSTGRAMKRLNRYLSLSEFVPTAQNDETPATKKRRINWLSRALSAEIQIPGGSTYTLAQSDPQQLKSTPQCIYCSAKRFEHEPPNFCCESGCIKLARTPAPTELYELLTAQTEDAKQFRKYLRAYNSIFAFTSFGVKLDKELASSRKGVYTFRAQGQIYHDLPSLRPHDNKPCYFQLYFFDTENELTNRLSILDDGVLSADIVAKIKQIMSGNPYAQIFRQLKDHSSFENLQLRIAANAKLDQRVYNKPSTDQVAAIWIDGNNADISFERQIVVHEHSGNKHRVKHYFGCYDPLQYPLLLPKGEPGWHQGIKKDRKPRQSSSIVESDVPIFNSADAVFANEAQDVHRDSKSVVSCREYYCYKLQVRAEDKSVLLLCGRLLQQFVVDMYIKLETTRLEFYRNEQSNLRREVLQGIVDSIMAGEYRGDKIGHRIYLPASFIGGPRDMRKRYMDAMTLVQHYGKPDLFITITCNPEWPEITEALAAGQTPQDRPDLVTRVFRAKLQDLKDQIFNKHIFGIVAAHVFVVEFQKRGLPHIHLLLILKESHKIKTADQYDKFISAEIPNKADYPLLYDIVVRHMMHGPCGPKHPSNTCMKDGQCKYHYPRPFSNKSAQAKDGYPIYKRRNDNRFENVRGTRMNNQWVVPYNPYLLTRYNCHINVEVCSGVKAIKYLYKYIYKGHDRCAVYIESEDGEKFIDEIQNYQDARWVAAPEVLWRIYQFSLSEIQPPVINLQLHLPNRQTGENVGRTMLTEYFSMCRTSAEARKYLYKEFPEHYVWKTQSKMWTPRKKKTVVGRIATANPREGERYYERLLLNHVRGPTSFEDLLTVNGRQCETFKEAAKERGLLESDNSISECLGEAVLFKMPSALRSLFATILVHCNPTDVRRLWETYYLDLSEDYRRNHDSSSNIPLQCTLNSISTYLHSMGKSIDKYDLPKIPEQAEHSRPLECREILEEQAVQVTTEDIEAQTKLNPEQEHAFKTILDRVTSATPGLFFVDGPGGTGKTFLYRALLANVRSSGMIALATATSGVAASILPGGRTAHSRFDIPLQTDETTITNMSKQSGAAKLIKKARLVIWDEAPMAKRQTIETVDRSFRDIMDSNTPFGGKVIVFGGDFRQVLPVVPKATRGETVNACLVKSYLWPLMEKLQFKTNMRAISDPTFSDFLLRVGNGDEATIGDNLIRLPNEMAVKYDSDETATDSLIEQIFPSLHENAGSAQYVTERAILASRNEHVDYLNEMLVEKFPGESTAYVSFDSAEDDTNNYYQEEYLNTLTPNGLPPHRLVLKRNAPIMLLRNLDASNGLCNGTRLICRAFDRNVIHAEIMLGHYAGKNVFLPRIQLSPPDNEGYPFKFVRKQFPVRLCFAMTINKAQGQTISNCGLYLPQHVFSHGQLYVALSRGTSMSTTRVLVMTEQPMRRIGTYTKTLSTRKF